MSINDQRDDLVPYFKSNRSQIIFEFFYIVVLFLISVTLVILIHLDVFYLDARTKYLAFAAIGGFMGGWTFDAKWFYMVTAKGKDNEKKWNWEYHKFYWRILTPFVAGLLSFALFLLGHSGVVQIRLGYSNSCAAAFSFCYVMGDFSDIVMSKLSKIAQGVSGS